MSAQQPTADEHRLLAVMNNRLLDRLAIVVGLFGERGWAEAQVVTNDGEIQTLPLTKEGDEKIRYARKVLGEFGRKPMG
jgi:hypothetical protein